MTASGTSIQTPSPGVTGADALCQSAATGALLGGTWKAIVARAPADGIGALADVGPWYRMDGVLAFNNRAQLRNTPSAPIYLDELGNSQGLGDCVWTGMMTGGIYANACENNINGSQVWTSGNSAQSGTFGSIGATDSTWIYTSTANCDLRCHLYCIEQ
jgi:hypothetical protein